MNYHSLGKTGLQVSNLGYGAWGIGKGMWPGGDDDESLRSIRQRSSTVSTSSTPPSAMGMDTAKR